MRRWRWFGRLVPLIAILTAGLTAGCAGRDFARPEPQSLVVGKTTYDEIIGRFGDPYRKGASLKEGQSVTSISYAYVRGVGSGFGGVTPARSVGFHFVNGVLVGYEFTSSFREDSTDFDETKVAQIKKGTTRDQVESMIGPSGGVYVYPMIKTQSARAIVYLYSQTKAAPFSVKFYQKRLVVSFDASSVVTGVDFTTSGER